MEFSEDLKKVENEIAVQENKPLNVFQNTSKKEQTKEEDSKDKLVKTMFEQAVIAKVQTDENLQQRVLNTANTFVDTKMKTIEKDVDTEHKEANFNNKKDACESYGFNEKTTPIWATNVMNWGYNVMLAIWLFIGTFTFMPIIFVMKKINVGLKRTWLALIFALMLYLGVTLVPILIGFIRG